MGFFSWECKHCGQSIKSPYQTIPAWHNHATAILSSGSLIQGAYDGYGKIGGADITDTQPTMYHTKCWEAIGKPTDYKGESESARDQGHFYDSPCDDCGNIDTEAGCEGCDFEQ